MTTISFSILALCNLFLLIKSINKGRKGLAIFTALLILGCIVTIILINKHIIH